MTWNEGHLLRRVPLFFYPLAAEHRAFSEALHAAEQTHEAHNIPGTRVRGTNKNGGLSQDETALRDRIGRRVETLAGKVTRASNGSDGNNLAAPIKRRGYPFSFTLGLTKGVLY